MRVRHLLAAGIGLLAATGGITLVAPGTGLDAGPVSVAGPVTVAGAPRPQSPWSRPRALRVVALGDSVPSGAACGCDAFPVVYGRLLAAKTGAVVTVANDGVGGLDSSDLRAQVADDSSAMARALTTADVVLVTIGANDFGNHHQEVTEGRCGDCVSDELQGMSANVRAVLARVRALRGDLPTAVLVTGYWNVFQDGEVARESFPEAGVAATIDLTRRTNAALKASAEAEGATYVDLFAPFQQRGTDITRLLAGDGDHPNGDGHALIARVLMAAGLPGLPDPSPGP